MFIYFRDSTLAGGLGAGFQGLFQSLSKSIPVLRARIQRTGITDEIRTVVKNATVRLGMNADDVTDDVIEGLVAETRAAAAPDEMLALQGEREFGIPLTSGQRSLDDAALSFEDSARAGIRGEAPQRILRGFEQEQNTAIAGAKEQVESTISGGRQPIERASQAGGVVREGVIEAETTAKAIVDDAYEAVGDASLTRGGFQRLVTGTKKAIDGLEFVKSPELTPATTGLLKRLDTLKRSLGVTRKGGKKVQLTPTHIKQIEGVRKSLLAFEKAAANATDGRNISTMRRAFDDQLDMAVKNALFEGDDAALEALKSARGLFQRYAAKFRENPGRTKGGRKIPDKEGKFIEKLISDNPTDEQTINALFGASNFSNVAGAKLAQRFKGILGADSEAWTAVKQAALRRLMKTSTVNGQEIVSGGRTLTTIKDALEKNSSLMNELFSTKELGLIRRFGAQVKRTQPDLVRSRENPSGTAQVATKALTDIVQRLGRLFAISGEPTLLVTSSGVSVAKGMRSTARAKASIRPFEMVIADPDAVGTATGATRFVAGHSPFATEKESSSPADLVARQPRQEANPLTELGLRAR